MTENILNNIDFLNSLIEYVNYTRYKFLFHDDSVMNHIIGTRSWSSGKHNINFIVRKGGFREYWKTPGTLEPWFNMYSKGILPVNKWYLNLNEILLFLPSKNQLNISKNDLLDVARAIQFFETTRYIEAYYLNMPYNFHDYKHFYIIITPAELLLYDSIRENLLVKIDFQDFKISYKGVHQLYNNNIVTFMKDSAIRLLDFLLPPITYHVERYRGFILERNHRRTNSSSMIYNLEDSLPNFPKKFSIENFVKLKIEYMKKYGLDFEDEKVYNSFTFKILHVKNPFLSKWGKRVVLKKNNIIYKSKAINPNGVINDLLEREKVVNNTPIIRLFKETAQLLNDINRMRKDIFRKTERPAWNHGQDRRIGFYHYAANQNAWYANIFMSKNYNIKYHYLNFLQQNLFVFNTKWNDAEREYSENRHTFFDEVRKLSANPYSIMKHKFMTRSLKEHNFNFNKLDVKNIEILLKALRVYGGWFADEERSIKEPWYPWYKCEIKHNKEIFLKAILFYIRAHTPLYPRFLDFIKNKKLATNFYQRVYSLPGLNNRQKHLIVKNFWNKIRARMLLWKKFSNKQHVYNKYKDMLYDSVKSYEPWYVLYQLPDWYYKGPDAKRFRLEFINSRKQKIFKRREEIIYNHKEYEQALMEHYLEFKEIIKRLYRKVIFRDTDGIVKYIHLPRNTNKFGEIIDEKNIPFYDSLPGLHMRLLYLFRGIKNELEHKYQEPFGKYLLLNDPENIAYRRYRFADDYKPANFHFMKNWHDTYLRKFRERDRANRNWGVMQPKWHRRAPWRYRRLLENLYLTRDPVTPEFNLYQTYAIFIRDPKNLQKLRMAGHAMNQEDFITFTLLNEHKEYSKIEPGAIDNPQFYTTRLFSSFWNEHNFNGASYRDAKPEGIKFSQNISNFEKILKEKMPWETFIKYTFYFRYRYIIAQYHYYLFEQLEKEQYKLATSMNEVEGLRSLLLDLPSINKFNFYDIRFVNRWSNSIDLTNGNPSNNFSEEWLNLYAPQDILNVLGDENVTLQNISLLQSLNKIFSSKELQPLFKNFINISSNRIEYLRLLKKLNQSKLLQNIVNENNKYLPYLKVINNIFRESNFGLYKLNFLKYKKFNKNTTDLLLQKDYYKNYYDICIHNNFLTDIYEKYQNSIKPFNSKIFNIWDHFYRYREEKEITYYLSKPDIASSWKVLNSRKVARALFGLIVKYMRIWNHQLKTRPYWFWGAYKSIKFNRHNHLSLHSFMQSYGLPGETQFLLKNNFIKGFVKKNIDLNFNDYLYKLIITNKFNITKCYKLEPPSKFKKEGMLLSLNKIKKYWKEEKEPSFQYATFYDMQEIVGNLDKRLGFVNKAFEQRKVSIINEVWKSVSFIAKRMNYSTWLNLKDRVKYYNELNLFKYYIKSYFRSCTLNVYDNNQYNYFFDSDQLIIKRLLTPLIKKKVYTDYTLLLKKAIASLLYNNTYPSQKDKLVLLKTYTFVNKYKKYINNKFFFKGITAFLKKNNILIYDSSTDTDYTLLLKKAVASLLYNNTYPSQKDKLVLLKTYTFVDKYKKYINNKFFLEKIIAFLKKNNILIYNDLPFKEMISDLIYDRIDEGNPSTLIEIFSSKKKKEEYINDSLPLEKIIMILKVLYSTKDSPKIAKLKRYRELMVKYKKMNSLL